MLEGRKITAQEASQIGLVSQVFWPTSMMQEVIPRVQQMAQMSPEVCIFLDQNYSFGLFKWLSKNIFTQIHHLLSIYQLMYFYLFKAY